MGRSKNIYLILAATGPWFKVINSYLADAYKNEGNLKDAKKYYRIGINRAFF